jgi:predicted GNAT family N-acyltransferase
MDQRAVTRVEIVAGDDPAAAERVAAAGRLRVAVFVDEQGVSLEEEFDGLDASAEHAVLTDHGGSAGSGASAGSGVEVLATARLLAEPSDQGHAVVGRVAVRRDLRGRGLGARVMAALEHRAAARGMPAVELHAQTAVEGFYTRLGYRPVGETFMDAGIEHITMRKDVADLCD